MENVFSENILKTHLWKRIEGKLILSNTSYSQGLQQKKAFAKIVFCIAKIFRICSTKDCENNTKFSAKQKIFQFRWKP